MVVSPLNLGFRDIGVMVYLLVMIDLSAPALHCFQYLIGFRCQLPGVPSSPFGLRRAGRCQVSAQPLTKKTASLIETETDERSTSNVQLRTLNKRILSVLKRFREAIPPFVIRHSIFGGSL
jgi:hypothetical protein